MKWILAIYDISASTVLKWEQRVNRVLKMWLYSGHTLSKICLFSRDSPVWLPIDSFVDHIKATNILPMSSNLFVQLHRKFDQVERGMQRKFWSKQKGTWFVNRC